MDGEGDMEQIGERTVLKGSSPALAGGLGDDVREGALESLASFAFWTELACDVEYLLERVSCLLIGAPEVGPVSLHCQRRLI